MPPSTLRQADLRHRLTQGSSGHSSNSSITMCKVHELVANATSIQRRCGYPNALDSNVLIQAVPTARTHVASMVTRVLCGEVALLCDILAMTEQD